MTQNKFELSNIGQQNGNIVTLRLALSNRLTIANLIIKLKFSGNFGQERDCFLYVQCFKTIDCKI